MTRRLGIRGTVIAVTINWLVSVPAVLLFFTRVIGWPWDLTLLVAVPIFLVFVPGGYVLAVAAAKRKTSAIEFILSTTFIKRCLVLSLPFALFSVSIIWFYGMLKIQSYWFMVTAGLLAVLSAWGMFVAFRRLVVGLRGDDRTPADQTCGRK